MSASTNQIEKSGPRVAIVSSLFGLDGGGAGLVVEWLVQSLVERGVSTLVVTIPNERALQGSQEATYECAFLRPPNLYSIHDKESKPSWARAVWQTIDIWNPGAFFQLRRLLMQFGPDIVHVHKLRGFSPAVWHAARYAGVSKIVQTCHDYEVMSPQGTLTGRVGRLAAERHWILRPYQTIRSAWSRAVDAVTAPSQYTLDTIVDAGFFRHMPHRVIPNSNGLNIERLTQLRRSCTQSSSVSLRILYLGRLVATKGVDLLCKAVTRAGGELRLDIAGWGEDEARLRAAWSKHPGITFHGAVSGSAKRKLLEKCDALVVPSVGPEVFGIVTTEALAYGKPTVASCVGGIPEVICDERTGFLVRPDDLEALTVLLSKLATDPTILRQMQQACFDRAPLYSTDTVAEQYLDLYAEMLGHPSSHAR